MNFEEIRNTILNENLNYDKVLSLYIMYLKKRLGILSNSPNYDEDREYYINNYLFFNCYAYALRLDMPLIFRDAFSRITNESFLFYPGVFSGLKCPKKANEVLTNTLSDVELLNISGYSIAVMFERSVKGGSNDFHFARLNSSNMWSSKNGRSAFISYSSYIDVPEDYDIVKILKLV